MAGDGPSLEPAKQCIGKAGDGLAFEPVKQLVSEAGNGLAPKLSE
jgi:hypothetical protein